MGVKVDKTPVGVDSFESDGLPSGTTKPDSEKESNSNLKVAKKIIKKDKKR